MTAPHIIDPARLLGQAVGDASPDLVRHLLGTVINALLRLTPKSGHRLGGFPC